MEINGMAHVILTASNFERSRDFYRKLLPFLGMTAVIDTDTYYYCVGGRTALGISAPAPEHAGAAFDQRRVGLHHLCFRARERADVDELHAFVSKLGAKIIRAPREDSLGARLLLGAVRGSRWHQARDQPCSRQGIAEGQVRQHLLVMARQPSRSASQRLCGIQSSWSRDVHSGPFRQAPPDEAERVANCVQAFRFAEIDLSHAKAARAAPCRVLAAPMAMRHDRAQSNKKAARQGQATGRRSNDRQRNRPAAPRQGPAHHHHEPPRPAQCAQSGHDARARRSGAARGRGSRGARRVAQGRRRHLLRRRRRQVDGGGPRADVRSRRSRSPCARAWKCRGSCTR